MLKLRLLTGPRAGRQLRVSDTKPVSIGRRKGRLRLHDSRVSKNHAEIYFDNDMWILRDHGSANGTYVNRNRVDGMVELEPGDLVQMGRVLFKIVRCDGIGMDTQPGLSDELLGAGAPGIGAAGKAPSAGADDAEGDLDLEALFGEADSSDANDDSDIFAAVDEPAAVETPPADVPEQDEQVPEPIEAAFEAPADDDDSFFGDLGEATDTSDGADIAVSDALEDDDAPVADAIGGEDDPFNLTDTDAVLDAGDPGDPAEASDPFLTGDEEEEAKEDTGDLISLQDESGMGPRNSGTTLLTAVPHDDLVNDESESSGSAIIDAADETQAPEATEVESDVTNELDSDDEEDDQAPALVGLHLDQAPPQQPEVIEDEPAETESEPEAMVEVETEPEASIDDVEDEPAPEIEEPVSEVIDADVLVDDDTANEQVAATDADEEPEASDDLTDELLSALNDDETGDDAVASTADAEDAEDVLDLDEVSAGLVDEAPEHVEDALSEIAEEPVAEAVVDEPEAPADEPEPVAADTAEEEELPEGAPVFDIDAAFDALSEGLDDSLEVPAIGVDEEPAEMQTADPLAGSQLDVGYIKDALSKLDQEQNESADDRGDISPKASASPTDSGYIQSPPPGLNPSSLKPPVEPDEPYRPPGSNAGRWFFTLLLLLAIGGGGAWYITQHYDIQITGRDDAGPSTANASVPPSPRSVGGPTGDTPPVDATTPVTSTPTTDEVVETKPTGPNPFASGPVVLGQQALDGITRGSTGSQDVDTPSVVVGPTPPNTTDPTEIATGDPTTVPQVDLQPPVVVPAIDETPAEPQPPARIVFLVDASGSLVDSLPQMLVWLNRAVQTIESDERFAIYFFKSGEPISIKPEGMIAPKREVLKQIGKDWLSADSLPVFPSGRSNPTRAIAKALALNPTDIYFLSDDAFALTQGDSTAQQAMELVKAALGESDARVHGVQFFYRNDDSLLETLANETKGTFEFVRERVVPNADPIDLLEELGGE